MFEPLSVRDVARHYQPKADSGAPIALREAPDVFADAALADEAGRLLFVSLWGRDTAIQHCLATLSLPVAEGGVDELTLTDVPPGRLRVPDVDHLTRHTGRVQTTVFGPLVHLFLYDRLLATQDATHRRAILLRREDAPAPERLWALLQRTCHLPMLPHWADPVIDRFLREGWIRRLDGFHCSADVLDLGDERLEPVIETMIQEGTLTLSA